MRRDIIASMKKLSSLSVVFPAYNDGKTIGTLIQRVLPLLSKHVKSWEIIVVNDASIDNTQKVLNRLQKNIARLRVITHGENRGYGGALISGFSAAAKEFIFYTDSDGQYDVGELPKLIETMDENTDMVTGYKIARSDPRYRILIGNAYNYSIKHLLGLAVRDVDCDFRLFRRKILSGIVLRIKSGAFDAEFLKKLEQKGTRIREIPVHHYARKYGHSQMFSPLRVGKSLWDVGKILFSS